MKIKKIIMTMAMLCVKNFFCSENCSSGSYSGKSEFSLRPIAIPNPMSCSKAFLLLSPPEGSSWLKNFACCEISHIGIYFICQIADQRDSGSSFANIFSNIFLIQKKNIHKILSSWLIAYAVTAKTIYNEIIAYNDRVEKELYETKLNISIDSAFILIDSALKITPKGEDILSKYKKNYNEDTEEYTFPSKEQAQEFINEICAFIENAIRKFAIFKI